MEARLSPGTWTVCVDQTVVIWPVLVANHVEMLPPNTVTTEISAIATRAMRRPYSVTAIPSSERKNFFITGASSGDGQGRSLNRLRGPSSHCGPGVQAVAGLCENRTST